ncbi:MAG: hypothetical protein AB8D52_05440 [Gammaproteobacteria bacterium]
MLLLCKLWPWLAGGLIGWLLSGWFARRLKYGEPPEERIIEKEVEVEKIVDNPKHLALISKLENTKPTTVEVEKLVDNPEHLKRINLLQDEINVLKQRKPETVEVQKLVDNPDHLQRIGQLEDEVNLWKRGPAIDLPAARAAGISIKKEDDFTAIEGIGPKINDLIHEDGIHTFRELSETDPFYIQTILDKAGPNYQMANPGTWPDQANLAASNRWPALKALQDILDGGVYPDGSSSPSNTGNGSSSNDAAKIKELEGELQAYRLAAAAVPKGSVADIDQAKAAGFRIRRKGDRDDFTVVEGIGPKINDLIHADGIHTYGELATTAITAIQKILDDAGPNFSLARPDTWPDQSDLAARNEWEALKKWQDELDGGKE